MRIPYSLTFCLILIIIMACFPSPWCAAVQDSPVSSATTIPTTEDPRTTDVRKQLQTYYDEMGAGFAHFNMIDATKYFSKDYRSVDKFNRKRTLHHKRELYQRLLSRALESQMKTTITLCTLKGDTATVQTRVQIYAHIRRDDGMEAVVEGEDLSRDFWVRQGSIWVIKQSRDFDFTITVNGQKVIE